MTITKQQHEQLKIISKDQRQFDILIGQIANLSLNNDISYPEALAHYLSCRIYIQNELNVGQEVMEIEETIDPNPDNMSEEDFNKIMAEVEQDMPDL